jgi:hypothetical protein
MKNNFIYILSLHLLFSSLTATAQSPVPVKKEPTHKIVFKNKLVTIMYPRILPGETTLFHIHETPSVFLIMKDAYVYDETYGKPGETFVSHQGETWYSEFKKKQVHKIKNLDSVDHQSILIEFPSESKTKYPDPIAGLGKPEYFERVRIYPLKLNANSSFDFQMNSNPAIMIAYKGNLSFSEKGKTLVLREGDIKWVDESSLLTLMNEGTEAIEGYIFEIRK